MKNAIKWVMIANSMMWLASMLVIMYAIYITKSAACLWFMLVPAMAGGYSYSCKDDNKTE